MVMLSFYVIQFYKSEYPIYFLQPGTDPTIQQIFDRIRVAVHKNRVRTTEFFKDYDRHKQGIITGYYI